jgi:hypothetical protein
MEGPSERAAAYRRLLDHVRAGRLVVDHATFALAEVADAWRQHAGSPGPKQVIRTA